MPEDIDALRNGFLDQARAAGCTITPRQNFYRIDGRHSTKWFNIAKTGTKVTLTGFCISNAAVMPFSAEDSHDFKIGRVAGIFDFCDAGAPAIFAEILKEIWAER
jgi:hypothetical protein